MKRYFCLLLALSSAHANLLRNAEFQDDWLTLLPELKNHNWNYSMESYNRRDYNPDAWSPRGSWEWENADAPWGQRKLILHGPRATLSQQVNWDGYHNTNRFENFPDAGGFPSFQAATTKLPERFVRDLSFRVKVSAQDVPTNAAGLALQFLPAKKTLPPATAYLPPGTYDHRWVEVKLLATQWLAGIVATNAVELPTQVAVNIVYTNVTGQLTLEAAELTAALPAAPNLLANGGFEAVEKDGYPAGWSSQQKYRYFPPRYYYIFNTWHNASFDNRGPVAADALLPHTGQRSLKMIVPPGDEKYVVSAPIELRQTEPRLIEVTAWIRTDKLALFQIDGLDEDGNRLDCHNFIHKNPPSYGSDEWRLVRQIFRPRKPLQTLRLQLAARGVNGYTLLGTGQQPQCTVVGTIWWDDVKVFEPESATKPATEKKPDAPKHPVLTTVDFDDQLLGANTLRAAFTNVTGHYTLQWEFTSPTGKKSTYQSPVKKGVVEIPYTIDEPCPAGYTEYRGALTLLDAKNKPVTTSEHWFATWTTPIDLELGTAYLTPAQTTDLVRINFGFSAATMAKAGHCKLEVIHKSTGKVLHTQTANLTPRTKIPVDLRDDLRNLLLADVDISKLPLLPSKNPQRNWIIRATLLDTAGKPMATVDSFAFCRLDYPPQQPAIESVTIDTNNLLYINGQPWLAWGVTYGHNPVYDGPADPGKYRDLHNLDGWNLYDRHGVGSSHPLNAFNCSRFVASSITGLKTLHTIWSNNIYASSAFPIPHPAKSIDDMIKLGKGETNFGQYLEFTKTSPMVVSLAPGYEEGFAVYQNLSAAEINTQKEIADYLRAKTGRPVMVSHGGYWNRLEFEKVPFYDIYDPETEPLYPANLHTDMLPLIAGQPKVAWLRPQMYEPVPYDRWRFHTWVEMMRGARGWQMAHGPSDPSLNRGLRAELDYITPAIYSKEPKPAVTTEPWIEHWSRRAAGKTYIVAATTHGLTMGHWKWDDGVRVTGQAGELRTEDNAYGINQNLPQGPSLHSIQYLPDARSWPAGTKLVQRVKLEKPKNLVLIAKVDGRWTHAGSWGEFDAGSYQTDLKKAAWFLRNLYRHASGFLGWDDNGTAGCLAYVIAKTTRFGDLPAEDGWVNLEMPLPAGPLIDGVAFLHEGGRVWWGQTSIVTPDGQETLVFGDRIGLPAEQLAQVKINVPGLKAGTKVRVAFEDREIVAADGSFTDDFRGRDLYQRHGGGSSGGYSDTPVALHVYELPAP